MNPKSTSEIVAGIMDKVFSGRFFLTVIVGILLLKTCWNHPEQTKEYKEVILVIIYAYFSRTDRGDTNGQTLTEPTKKEENTDENKNDDGGPSASSVGGMATGLSSSG